MKKIKIGRKDVMDKIKSEKTWKNNQYERF